MVALGVFLLARAGLSEVILPALLAPLVTLLPGAALTTGAIELATGQMISGAGRIAAGGMQLVLLALGITGAAALAGVPAIDLDTAALPLGPLAPWIAVAVFGVGILVNRCARPRSAGWVLLVLYIAYGAQVLGDALLGSVLSAFVGAVVMTPVAVLISHAPGGPPPMVSFLPAYWLLVPGALGLEGVTSLLHGDVTGFATLTTTLTTMVAVSLGVLVGFGIASISPTAMARLRGAHATAQPGHGEDAERNDGIVEQETRDQTQDKTASSATRPVGASCPPDRGKQPPSGDRGGARSRSRAWPVIAERHQAAMGPTHPR